MAVNVMSLCSKPWLLRTIVVIAYGTILLLRAPHVSEAKQPVDDLFGISFPTKEQGWACGRWGAILHTSDGGKTWKRQASTTDFTLSALSFSDYQNGWAVGEQGTIIHTSDGGKTWVQQKSPVPYFLLDVYFINAKQGWIVTERTTILFTDDGGATWEVQFEDQDYVLKGISFCDAFHGWAVGEYGFIYHTADGGKNWEHQAGQFGWDDETGEIVGGNYLFDVVALDPQTSWVVGIDGYVARTVDGGKSWESVQAGFPTTHLLGVASNGRDSFIICGVGVLLTSSDQGRTFIKNRDDTAIMYGWLNGAAVDPGGRMVAVGKEGRVFLSSDDGDSWDIVDTQ